MQLGYFVVGTSVALRHHYAFPIWLKMFWLAAQYVYKVMLIKSMYLENIFIEKGMYYMYITIQHKIWIYQATGEYIMYILFLWRIMT